MLGMMNAPSDGIDFYCAPPSRDGAATNDPALRRLSTPHAPRKLSPSAAPVTAQTGGELWSDLMRRQQLEKLAKKEDGDAAAAATKDSNHGKRAVKPDQQNEEGADDERGLSSTDDDDEQNTTTTTTTTTTTVKDGQVAKKPRNKTAKRGEKESCASQTTLHTKDASQAAGRKS